MSRKVLGKTMEEIMDDVQNTAIAGEAVAELNRTKKRLQEYQTAYEEEVQFRKQDQKHHQHQLRTLSSNAGKLRKTMCLHAFCWWLFSLVGAFWAVYHTPSPLKEWLYVCLFITIMITATWAGSVIYTHETFAETAARRDCENDYDD